MTFKKVIIPLPNYGFDPTETAIPWHFLNKSGCVVSFATPSGIKAQADKIMLTGNGLGIFKHILKARQDAVEAYYEMEKSNEFCSPLKYADLLEEDFDAILLPGGHDKGVKEYLESSNLQKCIVDFFNANKPVAAICHGVILVARSINPSTNKSVLYNYKTTALLASQELLAYNMTRRWLGDYYLTYPGITVQKEVEGVLLSKSNFLSGTTPLFRDDISHLNRGFTVRDRNYLSARWPGDVYRFSTEFIKMLSETGKH
ncbi:MAG: type 1 glutamine amidotransferase domain-containing protein [Bacteroidia bacterium]